MVGNKWKKVLAAAVVGTMMAGFISGCGTDSAQGKKKVGIVQIVQHPALDEANKGFVKSQWDSPDKRSRRIYTITTRGRQAIPYMIEQVLGWLNDFDALISTVREEFAD